MRTCLWLLSAALALCACSPKPEAEDAVRTLLNDPDSAKFTNETAAANGNVCGLVNAKNRFAAYVGATPFLYEKAAKRAAIVAPLEDSDFRSLWLAIRAGHGVSSFSEQFDKVNNACRLVSQWKDVCGFEYPGAKHRMCDVMQGGNPAAIHAQLKAQYD